MNKKASIWGSIGGAILILLFAVIILLILSPGFRELFLGFTAIFGKYEKSEISNSTYFALSAENVGITPDESEVPSKVRCMRIQKNGVDTNEWRCTIYTDRSNGELAYPRVKIFSNVKNDGTKIRTVYAKPIIGEDCESISKCEKRKFLEGTKRCTIAPQQTVPCDAGVHTFEKEGIYKIYPGYKCEVTDTDGCFEPGATKAQESYNGNSWMIVRVEVVEP